MSASKKLCKTAQIGMCIEVEGVEAKVLLEDSTRQVMILGISTPSESSKVQSEPEANLQQEIREIAKAENSCTKLTADQANRMLARLGVNEDTSAPPLSCKCFPIAESSAIEFYGLPNNGTKLTKEYIDNGGKVYRYKCFGHVVKKLISASKSRLGEKNLPVKRPRAVTIDAADPTLENVTAVAANVPRKKGISEDLRELMAKVLPGNVIYEACRAIKQDLRAFPNEQIPHGPLPPYASTSEFQDMADKWAMKLNEPIADIELFQKAQRIDINRGVLMRYLTDVHERFLMERRRSRGRDYILRYCSQLCLCFELVLVTSRAYALYTQSSAWFTTRDEDFIKSNNLDRAPFDREIIDFIHSVDEEFDVGTKIRELMKPITAHNSPYADNHTHIGAQAFEVML